MVNSRPLVYVDEDINLSMVLTPAHFLSLHSQHILSDIAEDSDSDYDSENTAQHLLKAWKHGQNRLNQFWALSKNEYMLDLRERIQRKSHQLRAHPKIGEVVLVKDHVVDGK